MMSISSPAAREFWAKNRYPVLLLLFFAWMCIGIFPLYCYESDSMHTIAGCSVLYNQGFTVPPVYSYEYNMQPLVYYAVAGLKYVVPFLSCEQLFCLLTAAAAMLFVVFGIRFVHRLTGIRREVILLAFFLLPESYAVGMYPNTAILAAVPFVCALNALTERRFAASIAWLCLAPLFRIDILMVYPVILFLFLWQGDSLATALKKSVIAALAVVAVTVLCYALLQANPFASTLDGYGKWNDKITLKQNFYALFSFYTPVNIVLLPLGLYRLYKRKACLLMGALLVPIVLNHVVYGRMGCATKHYLYILPFVAAASSVALTFLSDWLKGRRVWKVCIAAALGLLLVGSVRISRPDKPWRDIPGSIATAGPCLTLFQENITPLHFQLGIGAGFIIGTADEIMLASGNIIYPFFIHRMKCNKMESREMALHYLENKESYTLLALDWETKINLLLRLQDKGFSLERTKEKKPGTIFYQLKKGNCKVEVLSLEMEDTLSAPEPEETIQHIKDAVHTLRKQDKITYLLAIRGSLQTYVFDKFAQENLVTRLSDCFYLISPETTPAP